MGLEDLCEFVSFLPLPSFQPASVVSLGTPISDNGTWPSLFSSPSGWLLLPGTSSQPHEPGALGRQISA